jgi:DNA-binding transcriptional ArsR family regulator
VTTQIDGDGSLVDASDVVEPSPADVDAAVAALKLLADGTRVRIVWHLLHGEHNVNELAGHLAMAPAAISQHLAKLRLAGVVRTRRDGNRIFYAAHDHHIEALIAEALRHGEHLPHGEAS